LTKDSSGILDETFIGALRWIVFEALVEIELFSGEH
jgi:hypothetical protein